MKLKPVTHLYSVYNAFVYFYTNVLHDKRKRLVGTKETASLYSVDKCLKKRQIFHWLQN